MRIAVFIKNTTLHENYGGLETQNKMLCEGLAKKGHSVVVYSPQHDLEVEEAFENSVSYRFIPSVYKLTFAKVSKDNWVNKSYEQFKSDHENDPFDLVLSQSSAGLGVIEHKNEFPVKVISISHGTIMGELKTRFESCAGIKDYLRLLLDIVYVLRVFFGRQRKFVLGSNKVIAVSSAVKKALVEETFVPEDRVSVVFNGMPQDIFEDKSKGASESNVLKLIYVGRVIKSKGLFGLINALRALEDVSLKIVGDGEDLNELQQKVNSLGMSEKIEFVGKVDHEGVLEHLFSSDVFVLPTLRVEGFPMTLVEAMFAWLPLLAFDMGGVRDAVFDGENGFLLPVKDWEGLKSKVELLRDSPEKRKVFSENSKRFAKEKYSLESMIQSYQKIFKEVLTEK